MSVRTAAGIVDVAHPRYNQGTGHRSQQSILPPPYLRRTVPLTGGNAWDAAMLDV